MNKLIFFLLLVSCKAHVKNMLFKNYEKKKIENLLKNVNKLQKNVFITKHITTQKKNKKQKYTIKKYSVKEFCSTFYKSNKKFNYDHIIDSSDACVSLRYEQIQKIKNIQMYNFIKHKNIEKIIHSLSKKYCLVMPSEIVRIIKQFFIKPLNNKNTLELLQVNIIDVFQIIINSSYKNFMLLITDPSVIIKSFTEFKMFIFPIKRYNYEDHSKFFDLIVNDIYRKQFLKKPKKINSFNNCLFFIKEKNYNIKPVHDFFNTCSYFKTYMFKLTINDSVYIFDKSFKEITKVFYP